METTDYCDYELAKKLNACGFDAPCELYYTHEDAPDGAVWLTGDPRTPRSYNDQQDGCPFAKPICSAPTLWQAHKWLREKKGVDIEIRVWLVGVEREYRPYIMSPKHKDFIAYPPEKSYEQALTDGIAAALELIERRAKKS